jgi:hypothetical protein
MKDLISVAGWLLIAVVCVFFLSLRRRGTLSVAMHSFRQFLQFRFFLPSLVAICAAFTLAAIMQPANPSDRLRLLQSNIFAAAGLVVAIIVLTQAAASFPREVDRKQSYHLFSKPLSREAFASGTTVGYSLAGGFLLLIAFLLNLILVALFSVSDPQFRNLREAKEYLCARSHAFEGKEVERIPDSVAWLDRAGQGITWNFLLPASQRRVVVELSPVVAGAITTEALVRAKNGQGEELARRISVSDNRRTAIEFEFVEESPTVSVEVVRDLHSAPLGFNLFQDDMGFEKNGLHIVRETVSFELNLAFGYFILFVRISLFAAIGVFCSSFLSVPVAVFLALFLFFLSHLVPFLSVVALQIGKQETHGFSGIDARALGLTFFEQIVRAAIDTFCFLFPDAFRFDLSSSVCAGRALSLLSVVRSFIYYGKYFLLLLFLSGSILKRREI